MGMYKSKKNFGWGKNLRFAAKNALREMYGHGHFSTVSTHLDRWNQLVNFLENLGIKDISRCELKHLEDYAQKLQHRVESGNMKVAYAQNLLSSVNTILDAFGASQTLRVSPSLWVGKRTTIREEQPNTDNDNLVQTKEQLENSSLTRISCLIELVREFGLRSKEASLLDCKKAYLEAHKMGVITIEKGTKGGRKRAIPIKTEKQFISLRKAAELQRNASNLIPSGQSWYEWKNGALREGREILKSNGIPGYHDQRTAYACLRYEEITGRPAPVFGTGIQDQELDRHAREIIANELGHNRIDVTTEYLGGRR